VVEQLVVLEVEAVQVPLLLPWAALELQDKDTLEALLPFMVRRIHPLAAVALDKLDMVQAAVLWRALGVMV
jgi:hypothetical protein